MVFKDFVTEKEKEFYLRSHHYLEPVPEMDDEVVCMVCKGIYEVREFKVLITTCDCCGDYVEFIVCKNAPNCDGLFLDWKGREILN